MKTEAEHSELSGLIDLKDRLLKQSLEVEKQKQEHELKLEEMGNWGNLDMYSS